MSGRFTLGLVVVLSASTAHAMLGTMCPDVGPTIPETGNSVDPRPEPASRAPRICLRTPIRRGLGGRDSLVFLPSACSGVTDTRAEGISARRKVEHGRKTKSAPRA